MSRYAERIAREYPVRRKPREKEHFRIWLMGTLRELGYDPKLQTRETALQFGSPVTNVVVGDPGTAKLIFTAHYDTGVRTLLPPLIMPTRPLTALLYLALTPVMALLGSLVLSFAVTFPLNAPQWTLPLFLLLLAAALTYLRFGPSETKNLNDNDSGVAALLETAAALTPRYRGEVAFAFLDGGFDALGGAKGLRARYPAMKGKTVFNVNCVARGDEILVLPDKQGRWNAAALDAVLDSFDCAENKLVYLKTDGLVYYPSDNRAFRGAFTLCACEKLRGFGRIIRPRRAEGMDEENIKIIKDGLCKLAEKYQHSVK